MVREVKGSSGVDVVKNKSAAAMILVMMVPLRSVEERMTD
jgi:hypothetical protein